MTTKYIEIDRAIETALLLLEEGEDEQTLAYNAALVAFIKNMENVPAADVVPSAQPEIIRCKDCKWYGRVDKRRFYRGMDCLQKHIDTIVPDRDFCSKAERRGEQDG